MKLFSNNLNEHNRLGKNKKNTLLHVYTIYKIRYKTFVIEIVNTQTTLTTKCIVILTKHGQVGENT